MVMDYQMLHLFLANRPASEMTWDSLGDQLQNLFIVRALPREMQGKPVNCQ